MDWQNQHCLLTGATGGIGQAIAHALAERGTSILLQGRNKQALEQLRSELPGRHDITVADLSTKAGRKQLVLDAYTAGNLTMLINNAGTSHLSLLEETSEEAITDLLHINLLAPMTITQGLLPLLERHPNSTIVNIGSAFGSIGFAGQTSYCASKFGLRGFTEALHRELADTHINVFYIAPRATATNINSDAANAMNQKLGNTIDAPEVVANALIKQLSERKPRLHIGFAERFFASFNALLPGVVDKALRSKLPIIKHYTNQPIGEESKL